MDPTRRRACAQHPVCFVWCVRIHLQRRARQDRERRRRMHDRSVTDTPNTNQPRRTGRPPTLRRGPWRCFHVSCSVARRPTRTSRRGSFDVCSSCSCASLVPRPRRRKVRRSPNRNQGGTDRADTNRPNRIARASVATPHDAAARAHGKAWAQKGRVLVGRIDRCGAGREDKSPGSARQGSTT